MAAEFCPKKLAFARKIMALLSRGLQPIGSQLFSLLIYNFFDFGMYNRDKVEKSN